MHRNKIMPEEKILIRTGLKRNKEESYAAYKLRQAYEKLKQKVDLCGMVFWDSNKQGTYRKPK